MSFAALPSSLAGDLNVFFGGAMTESPVTRIEIADCIADTFQDGDASRLQLIERAVAMHARPEVLATLETLPDRNYPTMRDLWHYLPDLPVELSLVK